MNDEFPIVSPASVLAGSGGESIEELKTLIARRPKGPDLLSRIPSANDYKIAPLGVLDRVLVAMSQIRQLGREAGRDINVRPMWPVRGVAVLFLLHTNISWHEAESRGPGTSKRLL